jgi:hypothetical protein
MAIETWIQFYESVYAKIYGGKSTKYAYTSDFKGPFILNINFMSRDRVFIVRVNTPLVTLHPRILSILLDKELFLVFR